MVAGVALWLLAACAAGGRDGSRADQSTQHAVTSSSGVRRSELAGQEAVSDTVPHDSLVAADYKGVDARGIPHYYARTLSAADADLLRRAYGIEDPHRLYVSDSTEEGILKYDTQRKRCLTCYVNSYRVGYVSVRRPRESWEHAEARVRGTPARVFTGGPMPASTATADLDPDVRPLADWKRSQRTQNAITNLQNTGSLRWRKAITGFVVVTCACTVTRPKAQTSGPAAPSPFICGRKTRWSAMCLTAIRCAALAR